MGRRRLTDEQRAAIRDRYVARESQATIAAALGLGVRTVTEHLAKMGITRSDRDKPAEESSGTDYASAYVDLGASPADPLKRMEWYQRFCGRASEREMQGLVVAGERAMVDRVMGQAKVGATVNPASAMYHAKMMIENDADELDQAPGPEQEDASEVPSRSHRGSPRRGRPRKL